ncbi:MAG: hypothetical protein IMF15_04450 [Proteobacteria bacterium]|nr:hypothetical protein [Pseudomonadota bacterium]
MTQQHIDNDTLSLFVKTTGTSAASLPDAVEISSASYDEILDHLASCAECRDQVSIITTLQEEWSQLRFQSSLTEDQQQMICDYIDGMLDTHDAKKVRVLIEEQPDAMKAALHYQGHVELMAGELPRKEPVHQTVDAAQRSQRSFFSGLPTFASQFFAMRSPMIYTMAATAAVFVAVLLLLQAPTIQRSQTVIASFQDDPTIQFTAKNKLPGVGFFTQSGNTSKPFDDVHIELISEDMIKITWPKVEGAELYKMRIQVFNQGKKTVLRESSSQINHTTFLLEPQSQAAGANKRYEWVLYGNTADDRMFYASGGFVISEQNRDYDTW